MKNHLQIKKLTLTALFTAVAVVGSMFSFPVLGSKCAGTASGECTVRGNGRTMVGAGTGFYGGIDP